MQPTVVRLSKHTGIAASVPFLLGFIPSNSLVVIGLEGPRRRMGLTMRLDLPDAEGTLQTAQMVAARMSQAGQETVALAVYAPFDGTGSKPREHLIRAIQGELEVVEALLIDGGRCWSYLCDNTACCPAEGTPYLDTIDHNSVAAAYAMHGRSVLMTREEVVASVQGPDDATSFAVFDAMVHTLEDTKLITSSERVARMMALLDKLVGWYEDPRSEVDPAEVGEALAHLADITVRDHVLARLARGQDDQVHNNAMARLMTDLARKAPQGISHAMCTLAGISAYLGGDGVVANALFDRALASEPQYSLALLMQNAIDRMVNPKTLRQMLNAA